MRAGSWTAVGHALLLGACGLATPGAAAAPSPAGAPIVIAVDPVRGQDRPFGPTLPKAPLASLGHALDLVTRLRQSHPAAPITLSLAPGLFRLDHAVVIGPAQSGPAGAPLLIEGAPGGQSVIEGSVPLDPLGEALPRDIAERLPPEARGHVRLYRLPAAALALPTIRTMSLLHDRPATVALEVYDEQGALVPARWPDTGWAQVATGSTAKDDPSFTLDAARLARWRAEPDLWAEGFWRWNWLFEAFPVAGIDVAAGRIDLPQLPYEGIVKGARVRISHALSELDRPGEWWRDEARGLLVAWPRDPGGRLEVAVAASLIDIEAARHVRLDHLVLTHARGDLVTVQAASDVVIAHSRFTWAAGRGAVFQDATGGGVEDSAFDDLGGTALKLAGGDRASLTPGGLFVRRSRFARFARLTLTQTAAVDLDGVGAAVEGNLFADAGAPAIGIRGNDHRITGNELTGLLAGLDDNGAIYAGRDWTARGTLIEGNVLHDIRADSGLENKGIYLDDMASGFTIRHNLFLRVDRPIFIGGGRDNVVSGNVFVASSPAIHVDSRLQTWATSSLDDPDSELLAAYRAMPVASPLWRQRYPDLAGILADEPAIAKDNRLTRNSFVLSEPFDFSDGGQADRQVIADNAGPAGLRLADGADLAALARTSRDPRAFAGLLDAEGKPVGLDLGPILKTTGR